MNEKKIEIKSLIEKLNAASKSYYKENKEIMSNFEYDRLYDKLEVLEKETGIIFANSPTKNIGYEVLESLPKESHPSRMLSLGKTKERIELESFLEDKKGILSWKLDGLTVVLTYINGKLEKAVTRGNGDVGEVITSNAMTFGNLPIEIPYKGKLVLRGEAFIRYSDFKRINEELPMIDAKYKNPRNLCSGSVRQLNSEITANRSVNFNAFALTSAENIDFENSRMKQFEWLESQGFEVVERKIVTKKNIQDEIKWFEKEIEKMDIPSDGLVLLFDDISFGEGLGVTAKFPRDAIAFKWQDEIKSTRLEKIEWSASRTGQINPIAIFEPVELEGTTVARASVHNLSILRELKLGIGDEILVYKANMIIPQIEKNLTCSDSIEIPDFCPVCGEKTTIKDDTDAEVLLCTNKDCPAKWIKSFSLFVSRDAMNFESLSEATLEKFIEKGLLKNFSDLFKLKDHKEEIVTMKGFGEKSYYRIIDNIETGRNTTGARLIYALGISGIGVANAKMVAKKYGANIRNLANLSYDELVSIDGVGNVLAEGFIKYFSDEKNKREFENILDEVNIEVEEVSENNIFEGKTFVVTGSVKEFKNRKELGADIERLGGKISTSVSSKTDFLINNDVVSTSSKNKKAKELDIPIITELEYIEMKK